MSESRKQSSVTKTNEPGKLSPRRPKGFAVAAATISVSPEAPLNRPNEVDPGKTKKNASKVTRSVRYELENALLGLCDLWFDEIKPALQKNKVRIRCHGGACGEAGGCARPALACASHEPLDSSRTLVDAGTVQPYCELCKLLLTTASKINSAVNSNDKHPSTSKLTAPKNSPSTPRVHRQTPAMPQPIKQFTINCALRKDSHKINDPRTDSKDCGDAKDRTYRRSNTVVYNPQHGAYKNRSRSKANDCRAETNKEQRRAQEVSCSATPYDYSQLVDLVKTLHSVYPHKKSASTQTSPSPVTFQPDRTISPRHRLVQRKTKMLNQCTSCEDLDFYIPEVMRYRKKKMQKKLKHPARFRPESRFQKMMMQQKFSRFPKIGGPVTYIV